MPFAVYALMQSHISTDPNATDRRELIALALLVGACVAIGTFARFRGLAHWPLTIDEYYLAQSVQNILQIGLPEYPCGGLYMRGLALQYSAALLQRAGLSSELAPRLIAALCSLATLPAVYLLGRRLAGARIGLITVALLAVSVWEVEMARFGRMYAPFQAIFAWYLVFFFRFTIDRNKSALAPMLGLSVLGALVWEGGALLAGLNLLPPLIARPAGRFLRRDWLYLFATFLLCLFCYYVATLDLVTNSAADLPPGYQPAPEVALSRLAAATMPLSHLTAHPAWLLLWLVPAAIALLAAVRIALWTPLRARPLASLVLLAVLGSALFAQFLLCAAIVILLLLLGTLTPHELLSRRARVLVVAIGASVLFWAAYGLSTRDWHADGLSTSQTLVLLGYQLAGAPDLIQVVLVPLVRTVPVLSLALLLLTAAACAHAILRGPDTPTAERVLLAILILMLLGVSASHPPRQETRYVFFLYPVALLFAVLMLARAARWLLGERSALAATAALLAVVCGFALTEDFQPRHLWNIDTERVNFRIGMPEREALHYQVRSEIRGAARWLAAHVDRDHDVVVNGFPGVDFYYPASDFFFMERSDPRFENWTCRNGSFERWSNRPLLSSVAALTAQASTGRRVWIVAEASGLRSLVRRLPASEWKLEWTSRARDIAIISLQTPREG